VFTVAGVDALGGVADEEVAGGLGLGVGARPSGRCLRDGIRCGGLCGYVLRRLRSSPRGLGSHRVGLGGGMAQARFALQQGDADFLGAAGVDGGFVDDHIAGAEQAADGFAGAFERGQVRPFVAVDRGGNGDDADPDVTFLIVVRRCSWSPGLMRSGE